MFIHRVKYKENISFEEEILTRLLHREQLIVANSTESSFSRYFPRKVIDLTHSCSRSYLKIFWTEKYQWKFQWEINGYAF
jgi:hypothetical protein